MWEARITYLAALVCCGVFYIVSGEWLSAIALAVAAGLPWLSLILSLPAVLRFQLDIAAPDILSLGQEEEAWLLGSSPFPLPPFRGRLCCRHCITGKSQRLHNGQLPTGHCGGLELTVEKARVMDYLGLFSFPIRRKETRLLRVRPQSLPIPDLPDNKAFPPPRWQPKAGGGFSENHDLRLYRPGDSLNQVHWKLTAKTGKLTIREPLIPLRGRILVTLDLDGTPEELDRKLGQLLWLGEQLTSREAAFTLRCLTGLGLQSFSIRDQQALDHALDSLLVTPARKEGSLRDMVWPAAWRYHIGGEPDES